MNLPKRKLLVLVLLGLINVINQSILLLTSRHKLASKAELKRGWSLLTQVTLWLWADQFHLKWSSSLEFLRGPFWDPNCLIFTRCLCEIILMNMTFYSYAYDTQFYIYVYSNDVIPVDQMFHWDVWMSRFVLQLKRDKTEVLIIIIKTIVINNSYI